VSDYIGKADNGSFVDCGKGRVDVSGQCTKLDEVLRTDTKVTEKLCPVICKRTGLGIAELP
jgi:hypothetical protein